MSEHSPQRLAELLRHLNQGLPLAAEHPLHEVMSAVAADNRMLTTRLNTLPLDAAEIRRLMEQITGTRLDEGFRLLPPFTTDFGRNIRFGRGVFVNSGARFQDQGGIEIGDGCFLGHNLVIATLNHDLRPSKRDVLLPAPVRLGEGVWVGANTTILPGVSIGDYAAIAAGSVVTRDVPAMTVAAGVPARVIKEIQR